MSGDTIKLRKFTPLDVLLFLLGFPLFTVLFIVEGAGNLYREMFHIEAKDNL
jgi:hypothetical protein